MKNGSGSSVDFYQAAEAINRQKKKEFDDLVRLENAIKRFFKALAFSAIELCLPGLSKDKELKASVNEMGEAFNQYSKLKEEKNERSSYSR
jgi:hypothetical protein